MTPRCEPLLAVEWFPQGDQRDGSGWRFKTVDGEPWGASEALEAEARPFCSNPEGSHGHGEPCSECERIAAAIQTALSKPGVLRVSSSKPFKARVIAELPMVFTAPGACRECGEYGEGGICWLCGGKVNGEY